jgi:hypothetical protein
MPLFRPWSLASPFGAAALILTVLLPPTAHSETRPLPVTVVVKGSLPGIKDADLGRYFAETMSGAAGPWRFEASQPGVAPAPDRIEWAITSNASAEGRIRSFGFTRDAMERLMGKHQFLSIEVTLYLGGQYQTASHSEVTTSREAENPELAADIVRNTKQLIAYEAMDTTKPFAPK